MIQLRPQISLKVDKISKDGICLRIFGWILFYIVLQIMMLSNKKKYIQHEIELIKQQEIGNQIDQQETNITRLTGRYSFGSNGIHEVQLHINVTMSKNKFYELEQIIIQEDEVMKDLQYQLIVESLKNKSILLNETHTTTLKCKKNNEFITCYGYLEQISIVESTELIFDVLLQHHNVNAIEKQQLVIHYENNQYFAYIIMFQVLFLLLMIYGLYYFFSNLSDYPRQMWPKIHQWLSILLISMLFYNFPIQLIRASYDKVVHFYSNIVELFIQSSLFYFWLAIFELEFSQTNSSENQLQRANIWQILKFFLVLLYTVPQAIMDTFIFIMQEESQQFDPLIDIPFYNVYQKFVLVSLAAYSICFILLLYKSFQKEQQLLITEPQPSENGKHDPFAEGFAMSGQNDAIEIRNYKLLHILSTICFSALIYYQMLSILDPIILTTSSTINEWALINIYLCMVVQLYMPYHQPYEDEQQNQMYGDVEMDDYQLKHAKSKKLVNKKFYTKNKEENLQNEDIQI